MKADCIGRICLYYIASLYEKECDVCKGRAARGGEAETTAPPSSLEQPSPPLQHEMEGNSDQRMTRELSPETMRRDLHLTLERGRFVSYHVP